MSEVKRVYLPVAEPKAGDDLARAMVIYDSSADREDAVGVSSAEQSKSVLAASGNLMEGTEAELMGSHESVGSGHPVDRNQTQAQTVTIEGEQSATDTEMEDAIKHSGLDHTSKKFIHRGFKDLNEKIEAKLTIDSEKEKPASRGKK